MALPTKDAVVAFLNSLGGTEEEVAASVRARGIREKLRYSELNSNNPVTRNCIIALLLRAEFPELDDTDEFWELSGAYVYIGSPGLDYFGHENAVAEIPRPVRQLLRQIDEDRYNLAFNTDTPIKYRDLLAE